MEENTLVVYYSRSGNTKKIAETIHNLIGGDIFRIEPIDSYPSSYNQVVKQAKEEIASDYTPEIKNNINDISAYNKIYIGSPNWWNTIAPPVKTFLKQNDLSDKIIFPFSSHGGGGKGRVFRDIEKECNGSIVKKGLSIYYDGGSSVEKEIKDWLNN